MYLSPHQISVLGQVMTTLAEPHGEAEIRHRVGELMLELLGAQYYASYVWDESTQRFDTGVQLNMDPANLARYEAYYQFHDPITLQLQQHRRAVHVNDVMPQAELRRTEFFNDFLHRDGLYWGINLYAWSGQRNIGDMRIWRDKRRENFGRDEVQLLDLVRPALVAALERCRGTEPAIAPVAAQLHTGPAELLPHLSEREAAVARLLAQGLADKEIAQRLGISVTTVRTHVDKAFRKLEVNNRLTLVRRLKL